VFVGVRSVGGALTLLVTASSQGMLGVHVLADDLYPQWAESAPLCLAEDDYLISVQLEVGNVVKEPGIIWHLGRCEALNYASDCLARSKPFSC
jgi:hypothetical protein